MVNSSFLPRRRFRSSDFTVTQWEPFLLFSRNGYDDRFAGFGFFDPDEIPFRQFIEIDPEQIDEGGVGVQACRRGQQQ